MSSVSDIDALIVVINYQLAHRRMQLARDFLRLARHYRAAASEALLIAEDASTRWAAKNEPRNDDLDRATAGVAARLEEERRSSPPSSATQAEP